jgi:hypothetical protein
MSKGGDLRLLVQTQSLVIVFVKPDSKATSKPAFTHPPVFIIPTESLDSVKTQALRP